MEFKEILNAYNRIKPFVHRTPIITCSTINKILGCRILFKCENFQKVGAFKYRGATNAVLMLTPEERKNGVATHSSGNHAAALSLAAKNNGLEAFVVMPKNALNIKIQAVKDYGGLITFCEPTLSARESTLDEIVNRTKANVIHPYDDDRVIAGQGTVAYEVLSEYKDIDAIICPVGGGGLLSGTSLASKSINSKVLVYGAEPKNADDAYRSFNDKKLYDSINPNTIADGLLTSLSKRTFKIILSNVDYILTATEESIMYSLKLIMERMKIVIEPSSAVPLAVVHENKSLFKDKNIVIILSGGNIDFHNLNLR